METATLSIKTGNALKAWKEGDKKDRKLLEDLFGKDIFSLKITDRVKTFEDALEIVPPSENVKILLDYNGVDSIMLGAQAAAKLFIIAEALNEGWEADWTNSSQNKWYPWFEHKSGFGLSFSTTYYVHSGTRVGSRLCFPSSELAQYAGEQFADIYRTFLTK